MEFKWKPKLKPLEKTRNADIFTKISLISDAITVKLSILINYGAISVLVSSQE